MDYTFDGSPHADPRHANPAYANYKAWLDSAVAEGFCPFCPGGGAEIYEKLTGASVAWVAAPHSFQPLAAGSDRFVYVLREHRRHILDLTPEQFADFFKLAALTTNNQWRVMAMRFGGWTEDGKNISTQSILHLHGHTYDSPNVDIGCGIYPGTDAASSLPKLTLTTMSLQDTCECRGTWNNLADLGKTISHPGVERHFVIRSRVCRQEDGQDARTHELIQFLYRTLRQEKIEGGIIVFLRKLEDCLPSILATAAHIITIADKGEDFAFLHTEMAK